MSTVSRRDGLDLLRSRELHYIYRSFMYHCAGAPQPAYAASWSLRFLFNGVNAYLNGRFLSTTPAAIRPPGSQIPVSSSRHAVLGWSAHDRQADQILRDLRRPGTSVTASRGRHVQVDLVPNYLGELLQWVAGRC